MRRIALLLLALSLLLPSGALAARTAPGDGSLVVSNVDGVLTVQVKGVIFGHFSRGRLTVLDYKADSANALPTVSGAKMDIKGAKANVVYSGKDVRFLFPNGTFKLRIDGSGIDLSAVGTGSLQASPKNTFDDGTIAVNGQKPTPVPSVAIFGGSAPSVTAGLEKSATVTTSGFGPGNGR